MPVWLNRLPLWKTTAVPGAAAPNGFDRATKTYVEPLAKTTELLLVVPKAFPEKLVPAVNIAPLLKVTALAVAPNNL